MSNGSATSDAVCGHFSGVYSHMRCHIHGNSCCGCADKRSPSLGFVKSSGWRNGVLETTYLFRWGFYCDRCKDYWTTRLAKEPFGWSSNFPQRLIALMNSVPPLGESSTSNAQSISADTPPISSFNPIELLSIPSSSNAPPLAVAAPDARSDIPVTVAHPPTTSSPARDTPVTAVASPATRNWTDRIAARAAVNISAPTTSSPARDTPVTVAPPPAAPNWNILSTAQPTPTPTLSKSARKKANKRVRAAQEQERQRMLALQATPELPLPPVQNNVQPPGYRASAPLVVAIPVPAASHPPLGPQAANSYRRPSIYYARGELPQASSQGQPQTTNEAASIGIALSQSPPSQDLSDEEEISNDYSRLPLSRLLQPQSMPISTRTRSRDSNPLQTRLPVVNDSVAEAEPPRFGLGYSTWDTDWPPRGNLEAARPMYSPESRNYAPGVRARSPIHYGTVGLDEDEEEEVYDYDEWEPLPTHFLYREPAATVLRILRGVTPQAPPPLSEEMRQLAEDTSVILELIGKTSPDDNTGMDSDYKQIIDTAFENISKIRTQYRVALALKPGSVNPAQDPEPIVDDRLKIDSACIICCDEVSNTVLLPCNHLVLCMTCSDKMGIKGKYTPGPRTVTCPICRRLVLDRIKIFRG